MKLYLILTLFTPLVLTQYHQPQIQYRQPAVQPTGPTGDGRQYTHAQTPLRQYNGVVSPPPPLIISHKQSLTHDGGFNFAFAADNGLQHGESIAPDGTRLGGYSYVDPNGKKITVRYTAGKDGFKILEGDHIPRNPQSEAQHSQPQPQIQPQPQNAYQSRPIYHQPQFSAPSAPTYVGPQTFNTQALFRRPAPAQNEDDGQYRPEQYQRPQISSILVATTPQPRYLQQNQQPKYVQQQPARFLGYKGQTAQQNTLSNAQKEPDYDDEPGKPHSFGAGYAFEFSG